MVTKDRLESIRGVISNVSSVRNQAHAVLSDSLRSLLFRYTTPEYMLRDHPVAKESIVPLDVGILDEKIIQTVQMVQPEDLTWENQMAIVDLYRFSGLPMNQLIGVEIGVDSDAERISNLVVQNSATDVYGYHYSMISRLKVLPNLEDGTGKTWDVCFRLFPMRVWINDKPIFPNFQSLAGVISLGYTAFTKFPQPNSDDHQPSTHRFETFCIMSMLSPTGHVSTVGNPHIACDCNDQRMKAMDIIYRNKSGGISFLSPMSGRANGSNTHAGQIEMQTHATIVGLPDVDTYTAHKLHGGPADSRPLYYWMDYLAWLAVQSKHFSSRPAQLLTNNPEKREVFSMFGVDINTQTLQPRASAKYYRDNHAGYGTKARVGGHASLDEAVLAGGAIKVELFDEEQNTASQSLTELIASDTANLSDFDINTIDGKLNIRSVKAIQLPIGVSMKNSPLWLCLNGGLGGILVLDLDDYLRKVGETVPDSQTQILLESISKLDINGAGGLKIYLGTIDLHKLVKKVTPLENQTTTPLYALLELLDRCGICYSRDDFFSNLVSRKTDE